MKRKYWYLISITTCPPCGREKVYRTRMYTSRPEKWEDRHEFDEDYCGCRGY